MGMSMQIELFEALTEAGIKPEAARKVERQVELAISAGQDSMKSEIFDKVATKADIAELRADMHKTINTQMWRLVVFIISATTLVQVLLKFLG